MSNDPISTMDCLKYGEYKILSLNDKYSRGIPDNYFNGKDVSDVIAYNDVTFMEQLSHEERFVCRLIENMINSDISDRLGIFDVILTRLKCTTLYYNFHYMLSKSCDHSDNYIDLIANLESHISDINNIKSELYDPEKSPPDNKVRLLLKMIKRKPELVKYLNYNILSSNVIDEKEDDIILISKYRKIIFDGFGNPYADGLKREIGKYKKLSSIVTLHHERFRLIFDVLVNEKIYPPYSTDEIANLYLILLIYTNKYKFAAVEISKFITHDDMERCYHLNNDLNFELFDLFPTIDKKLPVIYEFMKLEIPDDVKRKLLLKLDYYTGMSIGMRKKLGIYRKPVPGFSKKSIELPWHDLEFIF